MKRRAPHNTKRLRGIFTGHKREIGFPLNLQLSYAFTRRIRTYLLLNRHVYVITGRPPEYSTPLCRLNFQLKPEQSDTNIAEQRSLLCLKHVSYF